MKNWQNKIVLKIEHFFLSTKLTVYEVKIERFVLQKPVFLKILGIL